MSAAKTDRVWRSGPPPHVGWWNASVCRARDAWRWWNGEAWSRAAYPEQTAAGAALEARRASVPVERVEWTDHYPADARVPRLDPTDGDWTFNVDGKVPAGMESGAAIEHVYRDGFKGGSKSGFTDALIWRIDGSGLDIVAWRVKPTVCARSAPELRSIAE